MKYILRIIYKMPANFDRYKGSGSILENKRLKYVTIEYKQYV